ncbi:MAG: SUMF1/EgtB/PvdO family nonheme iron enzyme [Pseudomonadota bacterium]
MSSTTNTVSRPSSLATLRTCWARSDALFDLVGRERWLTQGIVLRHPFLFYVGHLAAFAWNQLSAALGEGPYHREFDRLFELGIDPEDERQARTLAPPRWPPVDEVLAYRDGVREALARFVPQIEARAKEDRVIRDLMPLLIEHELMHQETLLYMIQQLEPTTLVRPPHWCEALAGPAASANRPVTLPAGEVRLGAELGEIPFGWDNEFPSEVLAVPGFTLDSLPVTIGDYQRFVQAGAYGEECWWESGDRAWLAGDRRELPVNWRRTASGDLEVRSLFEWYPLAAVSGWPVYVSHAEARAYCRWVGARLPSEAELHRAAFTSPEGAQRPFPWGEAAVDAGHGTLNFARAGRTPVGSHPEGRSAWGVDELVGNGWEWTSTPFLARPGFEAIHPHYPTYSANFFDGRHFVVFGASWATDARLVRRSFRNWFQRRYPYVFAKFRTVAVSR